MTVIADRKDPMVYVLSNHQSRRNAKKLTCYIRVFQNIIFWSGFLSPLLLIITEYVCHNDNTINWPITESKIAVLVSWVYCTPSSWFWLSKCLNLLTGLLDFSWWAFFLLFKFQIKKLVTPSWRGPDPIHVTMMDCTMEVVFCGVHVYLSKLAPFLYPSLQWSYGNTVPGYLMPSLLWLFVRSPNTIS